MTTTNKWIIKMECLYPEVLNIKTASKSEKIGSIFIGRPSKFGNPYVSPRDGDRFEIIEKYRKLVLSTPALLSAVKAELAGKNLICHCSPVPCHGDVLLKIANENQ